MAKKTLLDTSFGLIRTNVKLTTNVKLLVDSSDNLFSPGKVNRAGKITGNGGDRS